MTMNGQISLMGRASSARGHARRGRLVRQRELLLLDLDREVAALVLVLEVRIGEARGEATEGLVVELGQSAQDVGRGRYPGDATQLHRLLEHEARGPGVVRVQRLFGRGEV